MKRIKPKIITSFSMPPESNGLLDWFKERAKIDGLSRSELIIVAMREYQKNHLEGNPQTILFFNGKPPKIEHVRREARTRQAAVFLRFRAKLSYAQISEIVGKSYGWVYRLCNGLIKEGVYTVRDNRRGNFRGLARKFRENIDTYRERFDNYVMGRTDSVEETFTC